MNEIEPTALLALSVIIPKRRGEQHFSVHVIRHYDPVDVRFDIYHDPRRSPSHEPWIYADWPLLLRSWAHLPRATFRFITSKYFSSSQNGSPAHTER